jgi:hypothetical protein
LAYNNTVTMLVDITKEANEKSRGGDDVTCTTSSRVVLYSGFALLLEFLENSWNFENFLQGPRKVLKQLFLTSIPGKKNLNRFCQK